MESNAGTNALDAVAAIMVAVLHAAAGLMDAVLGEKLREIFLPMLVDRLRDEFIGCGSEIGKALERHILAAEQLLVGEDSLNLTDNLCAALVVETAVLIFFLFLPRRSAPGGRDCGCARGGGDSCGQRQW